jgi:hypothetical protein
MYFTYSWHWIFRGIFGGGKVKSTIPIVGVNFRRDAYELVNVGDAVKLVPEPDNPYDAMAVAAYVEGMHIGYVSADYLDDLHGCMSKSTKYSALIIELGQKKAIMGFKGAKSIKAKPRVY